MLVQVASETDAVMGGALVPSSLAAALAPAVETLKLDSNVGGGDAGSVNGGGDGDYFDAFYFTSIDNLDRINKTNSEIVKSQNI
jgi:hypothetical protein